MVSCLLLAAAAMLWPLRPRGSGGGVKRPARLAVAGGPDGSSRAGPIGASVGGGWPRALAVGVVAGAFGLLAVVAGVVVLIATVVAVVTGTVLVRRALSHRRDRLAIGEIASALGILGRELRAGAEPAIAATNAGAAAKGAGAMILLVLARLTRNEDRVWSTPAATGGFSRSGATSDPGLPAAKGAGPGVQLPDEPIAQAAARLRSGWLLTQRHGLAFTPLIDALAADLSEQIAAEAERAGQVAGPRMSGYVMAVLPLMGLALGVGMGADPFRVLVQTPAGNSLLIVGVVLTCAGLLWSARIVRR